MQHLPNKEKEEEAELIELTQKLLLSIQNADWEVYSSLCDPSLTCFEPEATGHMVQGMEFHQFYFKMGKGGEGMVNTTMAQPHVRRMAGGTVGLVSYVRLVQRVDKDGVPRTKSFEETRVWEK